MYEPTDVPTRIWREEVNSKHAFDLLLKELAPQIAQATHDREMKSSFRGAGAKCQNDLVAPCEQKGTDYMAGQRLRAEEREAITKAMERIPNGSVQGAGEKHGPSLAQVSSKDATATDINLTMIRECSCGWCFSSVGRLFRCSRKRVVAS